MLALSDIPPRLTAYPSKEGTVGASNAQATRQSNDKKSSNQQKLKIETGYLYFVIDAVVHAVVGSECAGAE